MLLMPPSVEIKTPLNYSFITGLIEEAGRICYKSDMATKMEDREKLIRSWVERGHHSMLEHFSVTVKFICNRGVTHELVRHRIAAYSQESTRYCDYKDGNVAFIIPPQLADKIAEGVIKEDDLTTLDASSPEWRWLRAMRDSEQHYKALRAQGWPPQDARDVLPNALKTEIISTFNLREWRHVFNLRAIGATGRPHPQMQEIMEPLLEIFQKELPVFFEDL